jgi:phage terminase small subunit
MALTARQELFCKEYLIDLNATQAAIRAGYSQDSAREIGSENLSKPDIQTRLQELMEPRNKALDTSRERILEELAHIAFHRVSDAVETFNEHGVTYKPFANINHRVIKGIREKRDKDGNSFVDVEFHDKLDALNLLGKYRKLWSEGGEVRLPIPVTIKSTDGKTIAEFGTQDPHPTP